MTVNSRYQIAPIDLVIVLTGPDERCASHLFC